MSKLDALEYHWLKKSDFKYKKNHNGIETLNYDEEARSKYGKEIREDNLDSLYYFDDPLLSEFSIINAEYYIESSYGTTKMKSQIRFFPGLLLNLNTDKDSLQSTIAHEIGHMIGFENSKLNGFDLSKDFKPLMDCYAESIKLLENQKEEASAEYIASEIMAINLFRLPKEIRRKSLIKLMEHECSLVGDDENHSIHGDKEHPFFYQRIAGIFGANPNIRKAIG